MNDGYKQIQSIHIFLDIVVNCKQFSIGIVTNKRDGHDFLPVTKNTYNFLTFETVLVIWSKILFFIIDIPVL